MSKRLLYGLILLILVILVLIFNTGDIKLNLLLVTLKVQKSIALLGFTCAGGVIGFLLYR